MDASDPIVLVVAGHVTPDDVPRLRAELGARLYGAEGAGGVVCDVGGLLRPNLAAVHVLAALQLDARRRGCRLRLRGVGHELRLLLDLVGLADVVGGVEPGRVARTLSECVVYGVPRRPARSARPRGLSMTVADSDSTSDSGSVETVTGADPGTELSIAAGRLRGRREDGVAVFRGIPYAQPPVGDLRFAAPSPAVGWEGVRDAGEYGPPCPQTALPDQMRVSRERDGEGDAGGDADEWLTVNVWSPAQAGEDPGARLPVMVWIHGGAYMAGTAGDPGYDGGRLAREGNVVVVTLNYRLGMEGFAWIEGAPANRGLLDQVAALEWVRDNIAAFGGDPGRVTLFGESAGAGSVAALLVMERAAGLFTRAIAQSVPGPYFSPELAEDISTAIAAELGPGIRPTATELAEFAPDRLVAAGTVVAGKMLGWEERWGGVARTASPYSPVVDGEVLPRAPWEALADGVARDVELIVGHNQNEYRLFAALSGQLGRIGEEQALAALSAFGPVAGSEAAYRAAHPDADAELLHELVFSDWLFRMPSLHLAQAQVTGGGRARVYELTWQAPGMGGALGACHALDLPLTFGNFTSGLAPLLIGAEPSEEAEALSARFRAAWTAFASDRLTDAQWPPYDPEERHVLVLDGEQNPVTAYPEEDSRLLWESHRFTALPLPGERA
ncbi:carboxylesterase/lipase family protein [Streptomyces sp. NPDC087851]|uniref:carboxylesterase/lipase family protein n=1 Tax=Streptomyces sp. NPDC087851 TaxID=3365810 RepID=UPI00380F22FD